MCQCTNDFEKTKIKTFFKKNHKYYHFQFFSYQSLVSILLNFRVYLRIYDRFIG